MRGLEYHLPMRFLLGLLLLLDLGAGGAYYVAGREGGPTIQIAQPEKFVPS